MLPTERALEFAIDGLDDGAFQRLAESYATIAHAERFARLAVHGRNPKGQTTTGWPDAFVFDGNGRIDALEASRDTRNWGSHLDADIEKARQLPPPGLGGLLFVSWARTPRPSALAERRDQLTQLVGDPSLVTLVFRQQLIRDLREGAFARVWRDVLGLRVSASPWVDIDEAPVYGTETPGLFVPTREEHARGLVGTPRISAPVRRRLDTFGWAYVKGLGASGKTVLGTKIGLLHTSANGPVYYCDLADVEVELHTAAANGLLNALVDRTDTNVMFIVDNIHQEARVAIELFRRWRELGSSGCMLMLGRQVDDLSRLRGLESPLAPLDDATFHLRVDKSVLKAAAIRLARRTGLTSRTPTDREVKSWLRLFGGDLVAFSAAFVRRLEKGSNWTPDASDAREYVEDRYLVGLDDSERDDLLLVADLSALELAARDGTVGASNLRRALEGGVVEHTAAGYRTVHPGLGELLLAAAAADPGDFACEAFRPNVNPDLATASLIASRLERFGRKGAARRLLAPLVTTGESALQLLMARGHQSIVEQRQLLERAVGASRLDDLLSDPDALRRKLDGLTLLELVAFGLAMRRALPRTRSRLAELAVPGKLSATRLRLEEVPPEHLLPVLRRVSRFMPGLYGPLLDVISDTSIVETFVQTALRLNKSRWRDLEQATTASERFARTVTAAFKANPEALTKILFRTKQLGDLFESLEGPLRELVSDHAMTPHFRRAAVAQAFSAGPNRLNSILKIAALTNPELLRELDALSPDRDVVIEAVDRWSGASKARGRLVSTADMTAPALAKALREAFAEYSPSQSASG